MSRIGKTPITIPGGVAITHLGKRITVKGPKGTLELEVPASLELKIQTDVLRLSEKEGSHLPNIHGLFRSLLQNAVVGVRDGWRKKLELVGVGYKAQGEGTQLTLHVGFTHPVKITAPANISFTVEENTQIVVTGIDKKQVGEVAAMIRNTKPPEPYKGKGIRYAGEIVRKKAGKAVKAVGAPA